MVVKYCAHCAGRPYTTDLDAQTCPTCGKALGIELVEEYDLEDRYKIEPFCQPSYDNGEPFTTDDWGETSSYPSYPIQPGRDEDMTPKKAQPLGSAFSGHNTGASQHATATTNLIRGKVAHYSSTGREDGAYRRLLPVKLFQALVYHQRLEDVLHRFTIRVEQGEDALGYQAYTDVPVNVHGTIAGGIQLTDNIEVEAHGKYCNGVLMADSIYVINNGHRSKVGFQRSVRAIVTGIVLAIALIAALIIAGNADGDFWANLKSFGTIWLVMAAIFAVLYLSFFASRWGLLARLFSNKTRSFPWLGILIVSLIATILFVQTFGSFSGFLAATSNFISSLIPVILLVVLGVACVANIFKKD